MTCRRHSVRICLFMCLGFFLSKSIFPIFRIRHISLRETQCGAETAYLLATLEFTSDFQFRSSFSVTKWEFSFTSVCPNNGLVYYSDNSWRRLAMILFYPKLKCGEVIRHNLHAKYVIFQISCTFVRFV